MPPLTIATLSAGAATLIAISAIMWSILLHRRLRRIEDTMTAFFAGKSGADLEDVIRELTRGMKRSHRDIQDLVKGSEYLHSALQRTVSKVAITRYNPFQELGGNQSFSIVLLNANNDGVVLSALHAKDVTRVYAKHIHDGKAEQSLSREEEELLQKACTQKGI